MAGQNFVRVYGGDGSGGGDIHASQTIKLCACVSKCNADEQHCPLHHNIPR